MTNHAFFRIVAGPSRYLLGNKKGLLEGGSHGKVNFGEEEMTLRMEGREALEGDLVDTAIGGCSSSTAIRMWIRAATFFSSSLILASPPSPTSPDLIVGDLNARHWLVRWNMSHDPLSRIGRSSIILTD